MKTPMLLAVALGSAVALGAPVVIDFEGLGLPFGSPITEEYASLGAHFEYSEYWEDINNDFHNHSGNHFIIESGFMSMWTDTTMQSFSAKVASYWYLGELRFYSDAAGTDLVHTIFVGENAGLDHTFDEFSWTGAYRRVEFAGGAFYSVLVDDIIMDAESVVPLPSVSAMAGLGLLGLGARRRRVNV